MNRDTLFEQLMNMSLKNQSALLARLFGMFEACEEGIEKDWFFEVVAKFVEKKQTPNRRSFCGGNGQVGEE